VPVPGGLLAAGHDVVPNDEDVPFPYPKLRTSAAEADGIVALLTDRIGEGSTLREMGQGVFALSRVRLPPTGPSRELGDVDHLRRDG